MKPVTFAGKQYDSLAELVSIKGNNICYDSVVNRLRMGWTLEDAITTPPKECPHSTFPIFLLYASGKYSIPEIARITKISERRVKHLLYKGNN